MRATVRWVVPVALLVLCACAWGCSCDETPEMNADGYVRCHLAPPPSEGEHRHGALRLRFEGRELTIDGLPDAPRLAVGTGPIGDTSVPDDVDLVVLLGDLVGESIPETDALVLLVAGGADAWESWSEGPGRIGDDRAGVVDATTLRRITAGSLELVPVPGGPPRYVGCDGCCGLAGDDAAAWALEPPDEGVHRVLLSWAAPEARGLLGVAVRPAAAASIRASVGAISAVFAWPRVDPDSVRPVAGAWVIRANGSRQPPGWTLYQVGEDGLTRLPDSP